MVYDPKRMGFFEHLDEFRSRLAISLGFILAGSAVAYFFALDIIRFLIMPLGLDALKASIGTGGLVATSPLEAFMLRFKVSMFAAIIITAPVWIYELLAFMTPALKPRERKWFLPGLMALILFFFLGVVFCYQFALAPAFQWMTQQGGDVIAMLPKASDYVNFVTYFLIGFGLAFETPVVVVVLVKLGIIKAESLLAQWRWAVVIIMIVASIATPDWSPVTMGGLALAMLVLYFGAALVARFI